MKRKPSNKPVHEDTEPLPSKFAKYVRHALKNPLKTVAALATFLAVVGPPSLTLPGNAQGLAGHMILYLLLFCLFYFCLCGYRFTGRRLSNNEFYLLNALAIVYYLSAYLVASLELHPAIVPFFVLMPTALTIMLITIMIGPGHARILSLLLPLGVFFAWGFEIRSLSIAFASGITAAFVLQNAKKRIDMVKAGFIVAIVNVIASTAHLLSMNAPPTLYPSILGIAALNGIVSGMLVLGITPLLEQILHSATAFRLIELLDLGAPLMRLLESKTPGTYNHSLIVANLAEAACRAIGARSLLARVGAYYHDIGKIDQPEYFVENQHDGNKHDIINPRLSATVIRSHVKLGIEKGRAAGLPYDIIDIIGSHHGNSLIAYFYNEALKKEENVEMADFCYPGHPPRTKEAAVVMLADVTEAAVRTLDKPNAGRIEKFINELITRKIDSAQLAEADLTFRELETIKKVFLRVLAAYYHTRLEYPNQIKDTAKDDE